jgi:hypothetical protein
MDGGRADLNAQFDKSGILRDILPRVRALVAAAPKQLQAVARDF